MVKVVAHDVFRAPGSLSVHEIEEYLGKMTGWVKCLGLPLEKYMCHPKEFKFHLASEES